MQQESNHAVTQTDDRKLTPKELRKVRRQGAKARRRRKRILCAVLALILVCLAAMPCYRYVFQPWQAKSAYKTAKNLYGQTGSGKLPKQYNDYFGALYEVNSDVAGWLIVSSTNTETGVDIHLPVVQPKAHDKAYYQTHLFNGKSNPYGTPYFANLCNVEQGGYNTVIRGSQQLLGELSRYRTLEFYKNTPTLFLDTLTSTVFYKIVAVVEVPDTELARFEKNSFATEADFHAFVTEMGNRSILYTGITVNKDDSLLTVLCDTGASNLAVIARAVRDDEAYGVDTSVAYLKGSATAQTITEWVATATDVTQPSTDVFEPSTEEAPEEEPLEDSQSETESEDSSEPISEETEETE